MNHDSVPLDNTLVDGAESLGERLRTQGLTMASAESCTGGWIAKVLTDVAGSSAWFSGSIVSYSNAVKERALGVTTDALNTHGAVSEAVVGQMAVGALGALNVDCAVSVSGVAGPDGGTADKPVGLVWMAVALGPACQSISADYPQIITEKHHFVGDREAIRRRAVQAAVRLLGTSLDKNT
ncbi:MAG: CinA family protein [Pseudomonadota bacterium]